ncbi:UDP-2-acetamido-2-deoxy-3-oxo-D-glucuronate aminotransferase [Porphyridium purpureum]|uniref:UDP-2-acetamido-2-deoxy-3-oxo-D-glucuronate aminotransferase n=1 Tax=Porphyridium purpureum TaxID=35688 RepID=A0A5J4Z0Y9_PORPP|nr:UDP-2-acetamido-2-deoxy-3-oxo-D-glucuronate aminotransferase [Porphyridium purpureum]|eukprot:POR8068..scf295_1
MNLPIFQVDRHVSANRAAIDAALARVLDSAHFILGPEVEQLEAELAAYVRVPFCVAVANGTDALQLALRALEIGPGDEVITTPFSWISSAEAICLVGATPVFVDIDRRTFLLDVDAVSRKISARTRAVIAVSLFGQMPDLARLASVLDAAQCAGRAKIALIEDGAQSFGASREGHMSCGWPGSIGCTSFFPTKPLGCLGDGGAVFTDDKLIYDRLRMLRQHGKDAATGAHLIVGTNSRLDALQAAVLREVLRKFPDDRAARMHVAAKYNAEFKLNERLVVPELEPLITSAAHPPALGTTEHVYGVYTLRLADFSDGSPEPQLRDHIVAALKARGVGTAVYYPIGFFDQPVFQQLTLNAEDFPNTVSATHTVFSIPIGSHMTDAEIEFVTKAVQESVRSVMQQT